MFRRLLLLATACGTCLAPSGEAGAACTRAALQGVVDRYIASQAMGDPQSLPILANAPYVEQNRAAVLQKGILAQPMKVEFSHSLLDVRQCQTFTELAVVDPAHPYVIGTQLAVDEDVITAMRTLVAGATNGPVDADNWVRRISKEDWGVLPREQRVDRATLIAAADEQTGLAIGFSHFRHSMKTKEFHLVGVPGRETYTMNTAPFDLPAVHIFKIWNGQIHEIDALGFTTGYMSKTGWE